MDKMAKEIKQEKEESMYVEKLAVKERRDEMSLDENFFFPH